MTISAAMDLFLSEPQQDFAAHTNNASGMQLEIFLLHALSTKWYGYSHQKAVMNYCKYIQPQPMEQDLKLKMRNKYQLMVTFDPFLMIHLR